MYILQPYLNPEEQIMPTTLLHAPRIFIPSYGPAFVSKLSVLAHDKTID